MAKGTTAKVIGEVGKLNCTKEWGVPVIYTFADGTEYPTFYTGKRKKDVVAGLTNGKLQQEALAAQLQTRPDGSHWLMFSWCIDFSAGCMRPLEN